MAESIVVYFSKASWKEVERSVEEIARLAGISGFPTWAYPPLGDNLVSLYEYNDIFKEFEPDDLSQVKAAFGGLPASVLCIELRRSKADAAVDCAAELTVHFLTRFSGMADDLIRNLWGLEEITQGVEKDGMKFLDCYRQKFLWRDRDPSP